MPDTLEKLAATFAAASDWRTSDDWGWDEWDRVADGEVHWVDKHTKLNQIFAVRALEMLAALPEDQRAAVKFPVSHSLAEMARENNQQGLAATLAAIGENPTRWAPVLHDDAKACIAVLREKLAAVCTGERALVAARTRDAVLDPAKLTEFRAELIQTFGDSGRLRPILNAKGVLEARLREHPRLSVPSLGFNQIDDKNAFIAQEHTGYAGWGRSYGQGLAQGEDEAVFAQLVAHAGIARNIAPGTTVSEIAAVLAEHSFGDVIVLQSLAFPAQNTEIRQHAAFVPKYDPALKTEWKGFNGFMGLLAIGGLQVPVFDAFVRRAESQNKVLVLDTKTYLRWRQYAPDDNPDEAGDIHGQLLIRVIDLNANRARRDEIIAANPAWLAQEADPAAYLRQRVLVNVYEKFRIDVFDSRSAICLTFAGGPPNGEN